MKRPSQYLRARGRAGHGHRPGAGRCARGHCKRRRGGPGGASAAAIRQAGGVIGPAIRPKAGRARRCAVWSVGGGRGCPLLYSYVGRAAWYWSPPSVGRAVCSPIGRAVPIGAAASCPASTPAGGEVCAVGGVISPAACSVRIDPARRAVLLSYTM